MEISFNDKKFISRLENNCIIFFRSFLEIQEHADQTKKKTLKKIKDSLIRLSKNGYEFSNLNERLKKEFDENYFYIQKESLRIFYNEQEKVFEKLFGC